MSSQPNVAFYIGNLGYGGAERVTIYLAEYFANNGFNTYIITDEQKSKEYILPENVSRLNLKKDKFIKRIKKLRKILLEMDIDLMVTMNTYLTPVAFFSANNLKTKIVVSERNSPQNFSGKKTTKFISEFLLKYIDGYVFQTKEVEKYYDWLSNPKVVIPNPLFIEEIPEPFDGNRSKKIVNVGRLHKQKNHRLLIKSFSKIANKYPDYELHIYGEGPERDNLKHLITELQLENTVKLLGSYDDVLTRINNSSLFILSSDFEGMPNVLIEAMAIGLPVIATDCPGGGPRELIDNRVNGILTTVNNADELAMNIEEVLNNDLLRAKISSNAVNIKDKLNSNKIGAEWKIFCEKILGTNDQCIGEEKWN